MKGALLVCGTSSDSGKSTVTTGLCRLLARRGVAVAPFKGQNMSLNAMVTAAGGEIGRAQWVQAQAAGAEPEVAMNPVLLKPTGERASEVVVMGRTTGVREAGAYQQQEKRELVSVVDAALASLRSRFDVVLCEGAGSPAEINLLRDDLVNLGLAQRAGLRAVLVGDIERGGVFAHLLGTVAILPDELSSLIGGFVINRFRGDPALLGRAPADLEDRCGIPTLGVLPHLGPLGLDAEDSLALAGTTSGVPPEARAEALDVAAIRLPRLSNFTDLDPLAAEPGVRLRWVGSVGALGDPDLVVLGGTRATVADLRWLHATGLAEAIAALTDAASPSVILGICGGFQMMGERVEDPAGVESSEPTCPALGWLPVRTVMDPEKLTLLGTAAGPDGEPVHGYEIRHGRIEPQRGCRPWLLAAAEGAAGARDLSGGVLGTTLHGLFEADASRASFLAHVASRRGRSWQASGLSYAAARQHQIDRVADACEEHLNLDRLWRLVQDASAD